MTKAEFSSEVAEKTGLTKKDAVIAVDAVLEVIGDVLARGEKLTFVGFGSFEVRERAAREGRNPRDPEKTFQIPARKAPVFKAGAYLKAKVDK
ncbi:MAG: HU family DNA-binding protein [Fretibacterium sp.]|nr:HU family DNA-binding protein [Fretibacterium sp.]